MEYLQSFKSELLGATIYVAPALSLQPFTRIIAFYGGIFSQWAECDIYIPELDERVNCAEQAMMLHKAKLFNDMEMYDAILTADHPRDQKMYGRMISNFDVDVWSGQCEEIVSNINFHKFSQSKAWKELLILTHGYELVEASPSDKIWGVGLSEDNKDVADHSKWQGTNLLGKCIMNARTRIITEEQI